MRVVVTGGNGVLGSALSLVRPDWSYMNRAECDVREFAHARGAIRQLNADVVVHAAALTDHQHPNAAEVIETNIVGTQNVVAAAQYLGIPVVYLSTHYIYSGMRGNYDETDIPCPIGSYAWSKLAGERAVRDVLGDDSLVVRGSWYTRETRLDRWAQRGALTDAWCSREPVGQSARKIVALVEAGVRGIVNIGGLRRSFAEILWDEGYVGFPITTRMRIDDKFFGANKAVSYAFPRDVSVNTAKFDSLKLELP